MKFFKRQLPLILAAILIVGSVGYWQFKPTVTYADSIAFDNGAYLGTSVGSGLTTSFTVGSGSNRILFVGVASNTTSEVATGITYAGAAMTKIDYVANGAGSSLWYLLAPASGANNVVVTTTGGTLYYAAASSYSGASQTAPEASSKDTTSSATPGGSVPYTINPGITTVTDNAWIITTAYGPGWDGNGGDSTVRGFTTSGVNLYDKGPVTPAGSATISTLTSFSGGTAVASVTAAFKPASAVVAVTTNTLLIQNSSTTIKNASVIIKGF